MGKRGQEGMTSPWIPAFAGMTTHHFMIDKIVELRCEEAYNAHSLFD
jgi:hypothetical protein